MAGKIINEKNKKNYYKKNNYYLLDKKYLKYFYISLILLSINYQLTIK